MSFKVLSMALAVAAHVALMTGIAQAGTAPPTVPEPTTMGLLGAGAAVVAIGSWWRRRK